MSPEQYRTKKIVGGGILAITIIILLSLGFWLFTHGRLSLTLPEKTVSVEVRNQTSNEIVTSGTTDTKTFGRILQSGKYEIRVFSDNGQASSYFVTVPRFFNTTSKQVTLANQNNRTKIGRNVAPCTLYTESTLYSFGCKGTDDFYLHNPTTSSTFSSRESITIGHILSMESYSEDGFIALRIANEGEALNAASLAYVKSGQVVKSIDLPQDFLSDYEDYTLAVDPASTMFVVGRNKNSDVLIYDDVNSQPKNMKLNSANQKSLNFLEVNISLYNKRLYHVVGNSSASPDSKEEYSKTQTQDTVVSIFDTNSLDLVSSYKINQTNDGAVACNINVICFLTDSHLRIIGSEDKDGIDIRISDVSSFSTSNNGKIYFIQNNTVSELDIKLGKAKAIFSSNRFMPSHISSGASGIVLTTVRSGSNETHAFLISKEGSTTNTFADEKLPYEKGYQGVVQDSDYSSNTLLIKLALSSWTSNTPGSTDFTYDLAEFDKKKEIVVNQFKRDFPDNSIELFIIP